MPVVLSAERQAEKGIGSVSENSVETAEDRRAAQQAEYGRFVAKEQIFVDGALAFGPGDPVPVSHVESGVVDKSKVVGANTKTAAVVKQES